MTSAVPKPPRRTAAAATATVAVVVLGLAAAPSSARAQPDPTPDPRVHVRSRTLVRARQIRTPGGGLEDQRSFGQRVDLHFAPAPGHSPATPAVDGLVAVGFEFDQGLPEAPRHPAIAERQLEPTLFAAWLRWTPVPALRVRLGRQDIASPLGLLRADGVEVRLRLEPVGLYATASAGLRPEPDRRRFDDPALADATDPGARPELGDGTLFIDGALGWEHDVAALALAARGQRSVDGDPRGPRVGGQARVGHRDGGRLETVLRYDLLHDAVERAEAAGRLPVGDRASLVARWLSVRHLFTPDSIFSVFPLSGWADAELGAHVRDRRQRTWATAVFRREAVDGPRPTFGGRASVAGSDPGRLSAWRFSAEPWAGDDTFALRGRAHATLRPPRGPTWHGDQIVFWKHDPANALARDRRGTWSLLGATFDAGGWAAIALTTTLGWDDRSRGSFGVFAWAELRLPDA